MKPKQIFMLWLISLLLIGLTQSVQAQTPAFTLSSSVITTNGELPAEYTCDGTSATLPLNWSGAPANTQSFALAMYHIVPPSVPPDSGGMKGGVDTHWYWVLYNIPSTVTSLPKNVTGIGTLGNNSVNRKTEYAPPCSQGPGAKSYSYTLYALSAAPSLTLPAAEVSRDVLLAVISDRTLATTKLTVTYTRPFLATTIWRWWLGSGRIVIVILVVLFSLRRYWVKSQS